MAIYSYSFLNQRRDLSDTLSTIIKNAPRFISFFPRVADAKQQHHEWLEDQIGGRSITATAVDTLVMTVSADDAAKLKVGTRLTIAGDSALFKVTNISSTSITVALEAANGSAKTTPAANDVLNIVSTPVAEGSTEGENTFHQSGTAGNYTQIIRKDIKLTGTALAISVYGNVDNQLNRQTEFALQEVTRDLNRIALFGKGVARSASENGQAGGLYQFGTQSGGLSVNASGARLDSFVVNDGSQAVVGEGGSPTLVLCSPGQARVLSNEYKDKVQTLRTDDRRGAYVAVIINEMNGSAMTIVADPDVPDTDVWVIDPTGFGISYLAGRGLSDEDTTAKGFDGIQRTALGELTFEFKNAKQRLCRIYGVKSSATALSEIKGGIPSNVVVTNTTSNPVYTSEVSGS